VETASYEVEFINDTGASLGVFTVWENDLVAETGIDET